MKDFIVGMAMGLAVGVTVCSCPKTRKMINEVKEKVASSCECKCDENKSASSVGENWQ